MTQADLARASGLSPATVSSIARELREDGWLEDYTSQGRGAVLTLSRSAGGAGGLGFGDKHRGGGVAHPWPKGLGGAGGTPGGGPPGGGGGAAGRPGGRP